ncbi:unnamed protein product, partial [Symbiodinium necroappetens]
TTWKAGKVTEEKAANYAEYKAALKRLQDEGRLPSGTKLVILEGHNGQAFAVKAALAEVETPLVCIHQHDLEFTFDFDLERVLDVLADPAAGVKYVGLPLLVNLHYEGIAYQHHGVRVKPEMHRGLSLMPIIFWTAPTSHPWSTTPPWSSARRRPTIPETSLKRPLASARGMI